METSRPIRSYGELRPQGDRHPYLSARALRIDASLRRQRLLQVLAVASLVLAAALLVAVVALVRSGGRERIVPYLVRVGADGAVAGVQPLAGPARATEAMVRHALGLFVINARTVTTDRAAQRQLILRAYDYATGRAVGVLNDYFRSHPPFARAATETVTPRLTSLLYLADRDVYEVHWTEDVRNLQGAIVGHPAWRALLTVTTEPPDSPRAALANPLGIKVEDLDWTRLAPTDSPKEPTS